MMCHPECDTCNGFGLSFCTSCRHFYQEDKCVPECTSDYYVVPGESKCQRCDHRCLSCSGGTESDCVVCKLYKVYFDFDNRENDPRVSSSIPYALFLISALVLFQFRSNDLCSTVVLLLTDRFLRTFIVL